MQNFYLSRSKRLKANFSNTDIPALPLTIGPSLLILLVQLFTFELTQSDI